MELRPEQLASQGADTALAPVYLIAGPETLRVLEAADAIRVRALGIGEREVFDADGRDFDWNQLDASFNAPSLFSARRLVEVRLPSGKPGKEGAEVISQFCANPAPDVVLMITANEWSKAHQGKWAEAVSRIGVLSVAWAIKPHELPDWIERRLRGRACVPTLLPCSAWLSGWRAICWPPPRKSTSWRYWPTASRWMWNGWSRWWLTLPATTCSGWWRRRSPASRRRCCACWPACAVKGRRWPH